MVQLEVVAASLPRHMAALSRLYAKLRHYQRPHQAVRLFDLLRHLASSIAIERLVGGQTVATDLLLL